MKRSHVLVFLLTGCMAAAAAGGAFAEERVPVGERLVYKITWLGIPVGTGEIHVKEKMQLDGREVIHVAGVVQTNRVLSKIFPMHDEAHSWIDAETLESVRFEKIIDELRINTHERMTFDGAAGKGYFESFRTGEKSGFEVTPPVHDVLSGFLWARRQPLRPGESAHAVVIADRKEWFLEVRAVEYKTVRVDGRKVSTVRLEPDTVVEGEEKRGRAWINVTADASRTPVKIGYKAPFGSVVGTLQWEDSRLSVKREAFLLPAESIKQHEE